MAYENCIARVVERLGERLSPKQAETVIRELERKAQKAYLQNPGDSFEVILADIAGKEIDRVQRAAMIEKRNALLNIQARHARRMRYDAVLAQGFGVDDALQAATVGVAKHFEGARLSSSRRQHAKMQYYIGRMLAELEKADLYKIARSRKFDREIARELWEISSERGKPGISGSKEAREIAEIIHKYQRIAVEEQNASGADIGRIDGYIVRQAHDRRKIQKAGREAWIRDVLPKLDAERTFGDADPVEFLNAVYDGLSTGVHLKAGGGVSDAPQPLKGFGNLAKRVSHERVLHFKSADDWMNYDAVYGENNLLGSVMHGLERSARNTVLMQQFGTNPGAAFDDDVRWLQKKMRGDNKQIKRISGNAERQLRAQFAQIDGSARIPESYGLAAFGQTMRALTNMRALGGVVLSSISDVPLKAAAFKYRGYGFLDGYANALESVFRGRGNKERRIMSDLLGVGFDGLSGGVMARFSSDDNLPGVMSWLQTKFFQVNGLTWWTDVQKMGDVMFQSRALAMESRDGFARLNADRKKVLGLYGIGEREFALFGKVPVKLLDGKEYLTADALDALGDADLALYAGQTDLTPKERARVLDELKQKLSTYYTDQADYAVLTPGDREQALMNFGYPPGSPAGEAFRTFMQFKSFSIAMITKVLGRGLLGDGTANIPAIAHLALMTTIFGYASMSLKDLSKGLAPRDPADPKTWGAAFVQGGGAGIYGDFLFGEYNRFGKSLSATLAGPSFGTADDIAAIYSAAVRGEDAAAKTFNTAINQIPGVNLFYVRTALNYLFIYQVQEALNPGYLRRMERRRRKEEGREFLLPPTRYAR